MRGSMSSTDGAELKSSPDNRILLQRGEKSSSMKPWVKAAQRCVVHAASAWLLIVPPHQWREGREGGVQFDAAAPAAHWQPLSAFKSKEACAHHRRDIVRLAEVHTLHPYPDFNEPLLYRSARCVREERARLSPES